MGEDGGIWGERQGGCWADIQADCLRLFRSHTIAPLSMHLPGAQLWRAAEVGHFFVAPLRISFQLENVKNYFAQMQHYPQSFTLSLQQNGHLLN